MYKLPEKSDRHICVFDAIKYGDKLHLVPGKTPTDYGHTLRHRTRLEHPCWFSKKPHIQKLSVKDCIQKYPDYMIWVYKNLNINWSEYVIEVMNKLIKDKEETQTELFKLLAL